jgi:GNAT superfamily N-acetyltransferase
MQLLMRSPTQPPRPASSGSVEVRLARPDDAEALATLMGAAFPEMEWSADRVRTDLLDAHDVAATYVVDGPGGLIGTASARYWTEKFPEEGYVHWVAIDPARRGQGLLQALMGRVMQRFADDGKPSAVLETDDIRLPAITAYLGEGFVPVYRDEGGHEQRWSVVFSNLAAYRRNKKERR